MAQTNVQVFSGNVGIGTTSADGKLHVQDTSPLDFKGITYTSSDVKTVITNDSLLATNGSMIQVYNNVTDRTPSAIDFHSEENFDASNVYTLCLNPRGGRIGLNDMNPNSDLTMGARFYNTKGYVGLRGDDSSPIVYKGDPNSATTTLPYTQLSTSNPSSGPAYYFINPYPGEAQCTIVYDNALSSSSGLVYFYQAGPGYQPSTTLSHSSLGNSEFTIPLQDTTGGRGIRISAIHVKPVDGAQVRIVAVYWVPYRGVTANIKDGGKLVLGTVGGFGTPGGALTFRREYETPTGNQLEPTQRLDNGIAWMTDLSTWYNGALGGNGINWSKNNDTYGVSVGARIWYQPGSFISAGGGAGNCGSLYLSAGHNTAASDTPNIAIKSNGNVGIGETNPTSKLQVNGDIQIGADQSFISGGRGDDFSYDGTTMPHYGIMWRNHSQAVGSKTMQMSGHGGIRCFTNGTERMTIRHSGNVGIGTASPATLLDVDGNGRFRRQSGWKSGTFNANAVNMGPMADGDMPQIGWEFHMTFSTTADIQKIKVFGAYRYNGTLYGISEGNTWMFADDQAEAYLTSTEALLVYESVAGYGSYHAVIRVLNSLYTNADPGAYTRHHFSGECYGLRSGYGATLQKFIGYIGLGQQASGNRFNYLRVTTNSSEIKGQCTAFPITSGNV